MFCLKMLFRSLLLMLFAVVFTGCAQLYKSSPEHAEINAEEQARAQETLAFEQAVLHHREGDLSDAKESYNELLVRFPANTAARINLVQLSIQDEDYQQAKTLVDEVLIIDSNNVQALTLAGVLARQKGEFDSAENFYRKALLIEPNYIPALRNLGILLDLYRGNLNEALALYEQAQAMLAEPDPKLKDWIFDIKRRIGEP